MNKTRLEELRQKFAEKTATQDEKILMQAKKEASASENKLFKRLIMASIVLPVGASAMPLVRDAYYSHKAKTIFPSLLNKYPGLKNHDAEVVKSNFNVLRKYAPRFASTPQLAGPWLMRAMQFADEGLTPQQLDDVMSLESHEETKRKYDVSTMGAMGQMGSMAMRD